MDDSKKLDNMKKSCEFECADRPEIVLSSIPTDKLRDIPNDICKLLLKNDLSFQQAEMLLDVAKGRLRRAKI